MKTELNLLGEDELIALCKEQLPYIPSGFEELVKRYQKKVFYLCKRYLSAESDAEDATQEVFMKVFHALQSFDNRSTFTTWIFSIAINHCKTLLAKKQLHNQRYEYGNEHAEDEYQDENEDNSKDAETLDEKKCIQEVIHKMKAEERDMILLRFTSELPIDDIAEIIGKKLSATKMGFYRALEKFKGLYEKFCL
ncbi:sigma-70 family RNA polymerase sigma factor [Cocleimonas flava]|jgi:RNA polymerase sigma-70 factor (ECF subfamily)|uniref:RNA polymerase sigma-70 factor (ECF subfamily) n=1 Tax=Cocleimonas flava TaxID=634765 RepID=A0A4R1FEL8_9GAMM|nr:MULTISPECIES: sigma-70 family RNA polymerase sigma factor [Cocleimonas]MEB8431649.1 sigma-70 family RNA polymerase sigma factor [Cocleimonas sp. KMM 6892]MEC4713579.1 sigma-70 family RNA polymerase sigma factor [Cocleimonas sp. KMM 6895]MEC4742910.1 sigma-70 family RNA polymerase sigma factor [Cocleimonas sp. KMM 6896]TCJ89331.1 RNA polymerase sigma-70 factor (ECF subfamily) [Cocleimonas flava]